MHMADALLSPAVGGAMYAAILNFVYRMRPELLESAVGGRYHRTGTEW